MTVHSYIETNYPGVIYASEDYSLAKRRWEVSLNEGYAPTELFSSEEGDLITDPDEDWRVVWIIDNGEIHEIPQRPRKGLDGRVRVHIDGAFKEVSRRLLARDLIDDVIEREIRDRQDLGPYPGCEENHYLELAKLYRVWETFGRGQLRNRQTIEEKARAALSELTSREVIPHRPYTPRLSNVLCCLIEGKLLEAVLLAKRVVSRRRRQQRDWKQIGNDLLEQGE